VQLQFPSACRRFADQFTELTSGKRHISNRPHTSASDESHTLIHHNRVLFVVAAGKQRILLGKLKCKTQLNQ